MIAKGEPRGQVWVRRLVGLFSVLGVGLFASRIFLESLALKWSWHLFLGVTALYVALALALVGLLTLAELSPWPLLLLYGYVLYPHIHLPLGLGVGVIALVMLLAPRLGWVRAVPLEGFVLVGGLVLYICTLSPSLLPADAGEFQFVPYVLGIAHPPGYPLYTMLGKLFTFLPVGDVAYRMNLFSALWGALALLLVASLVWRSLETKLGGLVAALALASVPTFWSQATTANIRSLVAVFTALFIYTLAAPRRPGVVAFAFIFGLGATHHGSLAFLLIPCALYLLLTGREWMDRRTIILAGASFLASLLVLLYLPIRGAMEPPLAPPGLLTPRGFFSHVLARGFAGDMFYFARPRFLLERLRIGMDILELEFGLPLLALACLGVVVLLRRRPKDLVLLGWGLLVNFLVAIIYRSPQTVEYLMPSYVVLAGLVGYGVVGVKEAFWWPRLEGGVAALLLLLVGYRFAAFLPSFAQLHGDTSTRAYAEALLAEAPTGAVILARWHNMTPLLYLQYCEGLRPDVEVRYVYPRGDRPMSAVWEEHIRDELGKRPVIVTSRQRFLEARHHFIPLAEAYLVEDGPHFTAPQGLTWLGDRFEGQIEFVGYKLADAQIEAGRALEFDLYWRPLQGLKGQYSFFFHLLEMGGGIIAQQDVRHDVTGLAPGEIRVDCIHIPLPPETAPGKYKLIGGVYVTLAEGQWRRFRSQNGTDSVELFTLTVPMGSSPSLSSSGFRARFGEEIDLLGANYHLAEPHGPAKLYLHWRYSGDGPSSYQILLHSRGEPVGRQELDLPGAGYFITGHQLSETAEDLALELRRLNQPVRLLGPWQWPLGVHFKLPRARKGARYIQFEEELALIETHTRWLASGSELEVSLEFLALRPILRDYTVSLQLEEVEGRWRAQHDGTPAGGAIPTLKWLRGMRIPDRHRLQIPAGAIGKEAILWLAIYDAFLQQRLGRPVPLTRLAVPPSS